MILAKTFEAITLLVIIIIIIIICKLEKKYKAKSNIPPFLVHFNPPAAHIPDLHLSPTLKYLCILLLFSCDRRTIPLHFVF